MGRTTSFAVGAGIGAALCCAAAMEARRRRQANLTGKVVLITGGSRGLGFVLCKEFARRGAQIAICARDTKELRIAREALSECGIVAYTWPCDVTIEAQVEALIEAVTSRFGRIDVLVNNAGIIVVGPEQHMTLEDYREAMDTHFWGPLTAIKAVLPQMRERRSGRIVNISSVGGKIPVPHLAPYSASKFALVGLSEAIAPEVAADGIAITTVCPGLMRTGSPENAQFKGQNSKEYTWFSLSDSLPGLSISAETAARQIVDACQSGKSEVTLSVPAVAGARFYGLFPELYGALAKLATRFLPGPGGMGEQSAKGRDSHSKLSPSVLTTLTQRAADANNEHAASPAR